MNLFRKICEKLCLGKAAVLTAKGLTNLFRKISQNLFVGKAAAWTAIFTCLLATFTGFLMEYTILLYRVTNITKDISITTQRAFIHSKEISVFPIIGDQNKRVTAINFFVVFENSGTTPTKRAVAQCNAKAFRDTKEFRFEDITKSEKRPFVIGPKTRISYPSGLVTIDDLILVQQNKSHLFFWGGVTYQDVFSDTPKRLTEFCYEVINVNSTKGNIADPSGAISLAWVQCEQHNCYDEDCLDYPDAMK